MDYSRNFTAVFRQGSTNFYNSSRLFPPKIRRDITTFYAFVRTADNYVDTTPQQKSKLEDMHQGYHVALQQGHHPNPLIDAFAQLSVRCNFNPRWIEAFFESMYMDVHKKRYTTMPEVLKYIYGSAEIVGLCILRIANIPATLEKYACLYGRALQYINFIRDVEEDNQMGRTYLPILDYELPDLTRNSAYAHPTQFARCMQYHIDCYSQWLAKSTAGILQLPYRMRIPIQVTSSIYNRIARRIRRNPFVVYQKKIRLSKPTITAFTITNILKDLVRTKRQIDG